MSESVTPLVTFETLTNTELGAQSIRVHEDGSVSFCGVVKKVTESMLTSYPRTQLNTWTPNRASIRYGRDEVAARKVKRFDSGAPLDLDGILALAS